MEEYVIGIRIKTEEALRFGDIPRIISDCIKKGEAFIVTAETYESWKEEQEKK